MSNTIRGAGFQDYIHGASKVAESLALDIARGFITGSENFGAYGQRTTAGAESDYVIWPNGVFSIPAAAGVQMSVVSTSAADAAAGTGIRTVELHYLDANLDSQAEIVTLNGVTPVLTVATNIRFIQCFHAVTVGSGLKAAGIITAANGGTTYSQINTGALRCSSSARMVPRAKRCLLMGAAGSASSSTADASVSIQIVASELDGDQYNVPLLLFPYGSIGTQNSGMGLLFPIPFSFQAGTVVAMSGTTDKAATIHGSWFGIVEDI